MRAIGIVKRIDFENLKEYVAARKDHEKEFIAEETQFELMYINRLFPEELSVRYDYGGGTYMAHYGDSKHKYKCKSMFRNFFALWETDTDNRYIVQRLTELETHIKYAQKYEQPMKYVHESDFGYYVENARLTVFIPKQFVAVEPFVDYSDVPLNRIGANESMSRNLPDVGNETQNTIKSKLNDKKAEIEEQINTINRKKEEQESEIEEMKRAIEEKYRSVFELMESKKQELELMMKQLEGELFVLDTQIYGIRCFFGEAVNFTRITSGKNEPVDTPVVMYQKIRFLDEELAKYASIYDFDGEDTAMFEELLKHRKDMRDLFFPEGKTVSLVRISRDGISYKSGQEASVSNTGTVSIYNVMKEYEVYHGNQIAILVRNGDNCYIGWTETDRISVSDGNVFLTPKEASYDEETEVKKDYFGRPVPVEEKTDKREVAARFFIFSIVQGLIEHSKLLELPEGAAVTQNSPYVVFSMAENWLQDNTYGDFDNVMNRCDKNIQKGDAILTLQRLQAEGEKYTTYNNDRGRGYANRTHDVRAKDNTIYQVNLVEEDDSNNLIRYEYKPKNSNEWVESIFVTRESEFDYMKEFEKYHDMVNYEFRNIVFEGRERHVFISLLKDSWYTDSGARANFELYRNEYLNLTFLNTVLIRYIITNKKMPKKYFHGRVNFSYILPYMNTAMQYLKEREAEEKRLIEKYVDLKENWQVDLTNWKLEHNVHAITEYQAKRFAKWYAERNL